MKKKLQWGYSHLASDRSLIALILRLFTIRSIEISDRENFLSDFKTSQPSTLRTARHAPSSCRPMATAPPSYHSRLSHPALNLDITSGKHSTISVYFSEEKGVTQPLVTLTLSNLTAFNTCENQLGSVDLVTVSGPPSCGIVRCHKTWRDVQTIT